MGPGQWTRTSSPRAARGPPPTHLGTLSWDSGAGGVKAPLLAPPTPGLTSNRRPAWVRGAGTEWPWRVSAWPRALGPGGGGVAAAWLLFTSCWTRASDSAAKGFPPSGPREGAPSLACDPRPGAGGQAEPRWGRARPEACVWGLLPGFPWHSAGPPPSPPPRVCYGRKRAVGGEGLPEWVGVCVCRLWCLPSSGLREEAGDASQAQGSNLWPLGDGLRFPKRRLWMAPRGWVTALIWHVDEQGTAFSLVLGGEKNFIKQAISQ